MVATEEALGLPSGPLSESEKRDRDNHHHKIKACSEGIGAALSHIYNNLLFRGDDGSQSWEGYVKDELPRWLNEELSLSQADTRRALYEVRSLIPAGENSSRVMPEKLGQAKELAPLIPRRIERLPLTGGPWNPAILDDPGQAQGIAKVWELACRNAEQNQRRSGPTADDVRAAREELRPALEQQNLIRSAPASQVAATAASAQAARQRVIDVTPPDPAEQERKAAAFRETMANIRATAPERQARVEVQGVKDEVTKAEREHQHLLDEEVRRYNRCLHDASTAIHALHSYLQNLARIHGTELLGEMRCVAVMGLITVGDDMERLQKMGQELMEAVKLARSSDPSTGINMTTVDV